MIFNELWTFLGEIEIDVIEIDYFTVSNNDIITSDLTVWKKTIYVCVLIHGMKYVKTKYKGMLVNMGPRPRITIVSLS